MTLINTIRATINLLLSIGYFRLDAVEIIKTRPAYWIFLIFLNYRGSENNLFFCKRPEGNFAIITQFNLKVEFWTEKCSFVSEESF